MNKKSLSRRKFIQTGAIAAISVTPAIDVLSQVIGLNKKITSSIIDQAFRLTKYKNLLNLEFYFINTKYKEGFFWQSKSIATKYNQQESYMIVRLPQQHIAEQALSFDLPNGKKPEGKDNQTDYSYLDSFVATTRISGYSYLVFRIKFSPGFDNVKIPLTQAALMDWNNETRDIKDFELKLVVRQNLGQSLFEITTHRLLEKPKHENNYPFGYNRFKNNDENGKLIPETVSDWDTIDPIKYDYNAYPKAYGDPITAIEAPWRIILSPKLPNQDKFIFKWNFSNATLSTEKIYKTELWTAKLTIEENIDYVEKLAFAKEEQNRVENEPPVQTFLEEEIRLIELMLLGSPDAHDAVDSSDEIFNNSKGLTPDGKVKSWILPSAIARQNLIDLYIKYKILARTESLMFSPLGISTFIELKNSKIESTGIKSPSNDLVSWKQLISFGRDEEVEVVRVILEKEFGHKYLHAATTKRRTRKGVSYLDYREYIYPMDVNKDYTNHENIKDMDSGDISVSKFKSPFKSIEIKELKPKRIKVLSSDEYNTNREDVDSYRTNYKNIGNYYMPLEFRTGLPVNFEYESIDWQDQKVKFNKTIQAIELDVALKSDLNTIKAINSFFDKIPEKHRKINLYQQDIAFTVRNIENDFYEVTKDTISNLKTDFLLFKGQLKFDANGSIDFFNQYASIPQLEEAQAYISSLNKLLNDEIPVNFKYAKEYLNNQLDTTRLEIEKNSSKVFAETTNASQSFLKGQFRKVAADMGGFINPELPVEYITYLKDPKKIKKAVVDEFMKSVPNELKESINDIKDGYNDLVFISCKAKDSWEKVRQIRPEDFFDGLKARILGSIELKDILDLDFELPRISIINDKKGLPEKAVYNFLTQKIKEKDLSSVVFYAKNKGKSASFQVYLEKGIQTPKQYFSFTRLSDFSIGVKPFAGPEILTIFFGKLEVSSSNSTTKKTDVKIDDIKFGGPLNFIGKLGETIKIPGTGLRVVPSIKEIEIGYLYTLPSIETPSFNLTNIKFDLGLKFPIASQNPDQAQDPLITTFSINNPDDKFLVSAGIFGGRGHFVLKTTPSSILNIDASIEFGGYFGINLGIAVGYVFLFAGIRYQMVANEVLLSAYIICSGGVTVFGFISVAVTFLLSMRYNVKTNELYGTASVSYSIKVGFFKKSFTLRYSKTLKGTKGKKIDPNTDQVNADNYSGDLQYASLDNRLIQFNSRTVSQFIKEKIVKNDKDFRKIYSKKEWRIYYRTFAR